MGKISKAEGPTIAGVDPDAPAEVAERTYAPATVEALAEANYCAYASAHGWDRETSNGWEDLRDWDDLGEDEQNAWRAAARDLRTRILEPGGAQPPARRPVDDGEQADADETLVNNSGGPVDDNGDLYPDNGSAADVERWVAGNTDRARYALDREQERDGGPRAGLSASLRKLAPADQDNLDFSPGGRS